MSDQLFHWKEIIKKNDDMLIQERELSNEEIVQRDFYDESQYIKGNISKDEPEVDDIIPDLEEKRDVIKNNMPKKLRFSREYEYIRQGSYTFRDKNGRMRDATKKTVKDHMKKVVDSLGNLDSLLDTEIPVSGNGTVPEDFLREIRTAFGAAIESCENYLEKRKNPWTYEGKARYAMVQQFHEKVSFESMRFYDRMEALKTDPAAVPADKKWVSVLADIRTEKYTDGKDGVRITMGGAGTSEVYIIEKDGLKQYFKQNEKLPSDDPLELIDDERERLTKEMSAIEGSDLSQQEKQKKISVLNDRKRILKVLSVHLNDEYDDGHGMVQFINRASITKTMEGLAGELPRYKNAIENAKAHYDTLLTEIDDLETRLKGDLSEEEKVQLKNELKSKQEELKNCDYNYYGSFLIKLRKDRTARVIATNTAKIKEDDSLTKRNVVSSRLAKLLGIQSVYVRSTMTEINVNGKTMTGIMMDDAGGEELDWVFNMVHQENQTLQNKHKVRYTGQAFKQLMELQVADIILGQVDRHIGNYRVHIKRHRNTGNIFIDKVVGIDNDMCGGELTYKEIKSRGRRGYNHLKNMESASGTCTIPAIGEEFAERILLITREMIDYEFMDVLSKKERDAMFDRINGVKNVIMHQKEAEAEARNAKRKFRSKLTKNHQWDTYLKNFEGLVENDRKAKKPFVWGCYSYLDEDCFK